jgi:hypothetical protein
MVQPDAISKLVEEGLKPFDNYEEFQLREADEVRKKRVTLVRRCHHEPFAILSNGVKQCLSKCGTLWVPNRLADLYKNNPNVVWVEE